MSLKQQFGLLRSLAIYYGNPWRRRQQHAFYKALLQPGDLCFDIGAHVGSRTGLWAELGATVVAVEPQPYLLAYLRRRYGGDPRIVLRPEAVGAKTSNATLYVSEANPTVTTLSRAWIGAMQQSPAFDGVEWDAEVMVAVTTLDALIEVYGLPEFCKIDVEGYELEVLQGLSQPLPLLSFEYLVPTIDQALQCIDRLQSLGDYRFNWSQGERQRFEQTAWVSADQLRSLIRDGIGRSDSGDIYACLAGSNRYG